MKRAISVSELFAMKKQTYKLSDEWREAFGGTVCGSCGVEAEAARRVSC